MNAVLISVQAWEIPEPQGLDSIRFVLHDLAPGVGRIIVECYGQAWAAFFSSMGARTIEEFLRGTSADYLSRKLTPPTKQTKAQDEYRLRVTAAVLNAIQAVSP